MRSRLEEYLLFNREDMERIIEALDQLIELKRKYIAVVDNPPYLSSSSFNPQLKKYVKSHYPLSKSDLMATFMERGLAALDEGGYLGMINQHSWMFLSSYEKLRKHLIETVHFDTMLHLGPRAFPEIGGEVVQSTAFTSRNAPSEAPGSYLRLVDFGTNEKAPKTRAGIQHPSLDYFYRARQGDFAKIPGWPVGYWLGEKLIDLLSKSDTLDDIGITRRGLQTGRSPRFIRDWQEISISDFARPTAELDIRTSSRRWFVMNSGGQFRKWYGNLNTVVLWEENGREIKDFPGSIVPSENLYGYPCVSWNKITSSSLGFRIVENGVIPGDASPSFFAKNMCSLVPVAAEMNSITTSFFLKLYAPTLNAQVGDLKKLPSRTTEIQEIEQLGSAAVCISRSDWNKIETSYDFKGFPIGKESRINVFLNANVAEQANVYFELHSIEEKINASVTYSYAIDRDESVAIPLQDITILQSELDRRALAKLNKKLKRDPATGLVTNYDELELPFKRDEIMAQFVSYAVGCMLGRYSLDKEGLILANARDGLSDYTERVGKQQSEWTFTPDADGILPVLAGDFFEDDIVGRFRAFLLAAFGEEHFSENLSFVEECLESKEGKSVDIRKYFTRDFYKDHVKRYKKRPIYWLFSSPDKHFQALVYLHRYTPDTVNLLLNDYLRPYVDKLEARKSAAERLQDDAGSSARAKTDAARTIKDCTAALADCRAYERDTLYPLALRRLPLDLDDGVLVNYNKLGDAVLTVSG